MAGSPTQSPSQSPPQTQTSTTQLLAEFAAKRATPYGLIPRPRSHHLSNSAIISDSSSSASNSNEATPASSPSSSLTQPDQGSTVSSSSSSSSTRQIPSTSVPTASTSTVPSLYNTSRGRTKNVSPSARWERRCTSASVSSPAASEDGNSAPSGDLKPRSGLEELEHSSNRNGNGKGKEREKGQSGEEERERQASSRERRRVENWVRKGEEEQDVTQMPSGRHRPTQDQIKSKSSPRRGRRKEMNATPPAPSQRPPSTASSLSSSSTSIHRSSTSRRRSSLLPPLSPPRSSENTESFRRRSSTIVAPALPFTETQKDSELYSIQLSRPHGALFSSDVDDEALFSDSCSSTCSSEIRRGRDPGEADYYEEEEEEEEEEDDDYGYEEYSGTSTSASTSLHSRPSLSRSASTSPEKRSSRSSNRRRRKGLGALIRSDSDSSNQSLLQLNGSESHQEIGSSSQASSVSPSKRNGRGRRKRRVSSVERGRRRELRVLLAPPSPAGTLHAELSQDGASSNAAYAQQPSQEANSDVLGLQLNQELDQEDQGSETEVLEFKSRASARRAASGEQPAHQSKLLPQSSIILDGPGLSTVPMVRSKSEELSQSDSSNSNIATPQPSSTTLPSLLNLGQLPARKWLGSLRTSVASESRSASFPSLSSKPSLDIGTSAFKRAPRERTSTTPVFVPVEADPLGSQDLDDNSVNSDIGSEMAVDDLIQVEQVVYDLEEDEASSAKKEEPILTKRSWGRKFGAQSKPRTSSISSQVSRTESIEGDQLRVNQPARSSTSLSTPDPPAIFSNAQPEGISTREKLRLTSLTAAHEQARRKGFAAAYAARLANVGTNLWNWNRTNNDPRPRSDSLDSSESTTSTIGEVERETRPSNVGADGVEASGDPENHTSGILASGWRNLTRLPNLILMPALSSSSNSSPSPSNAPPALDISKLDPHPALAEDYSEEIPSAEQEARNAEVLRAQHAIASRMGPPSSPSPPPSPGFNNSGSSSNASSPVLSGPGSLESSMTLSQEGSPQPGRNQQHSRSHQHTSSASSDSTISGSASNSSARRFSMSAHSKGARGVLSAWEGDFDSGAYVSGLGQPIDPDTELSSVVHLQTFRSRSRDRRDRTGQSSSAESSPKLGSSEAQRVGRSASTSALDDEESGSDKEQSSAKAKRNELHALVTSGQSRREQSKSAGSESMSPTTLLFRGRSTSTTTSTSRNLILAEAQRPVKEERRKASIPSSTASTSSSASASESALAVFNEKSVKALKEEGHQKEAADLVANNSSVQEELESVKTNSSGPRRSASLVDFSEQRRFAAREEERLKELEAQKERDSTEQLNSTDTPPNAIPHFRTTSTRPLGSKRSRSYRPAAEAPVPGDFCAFPDAQEVGENKNETASEPGNTSFSSICSFSSADLPQEKPQSKRRAPSRGRSGRSGKRRGESPASSSTRQCAVGLFSGSGTNTRRRPSNANTEVQSIHAASGPRKTDSKSTEDLTRLSTDVEAADEKDGRSGRRSRRGSRDEDASNVRSQVEEDDERGSRGRGGDIKVVSSSHGQATFPLNLTHGLDQVTSKTSNSRSSPRNSPAGGTRSSSHRTGRTLTRPASAPSLGSVLRRASQHPEPQYNSGINSQGSMASSASAQTLPSTSTEGAPTDSILSEASTSSDPQVKIPPARAPPPNSQAALNQNQYMNPPPRPSLLSNGAHLLMLSLELEMIRKRKISAPLKPRWGKQRNRGVISFSAPPTPTNNGEGSSTLSIGEGINPRRGSGLKYEIVL